MTREIKVGDIVNRISSKTNNNMPHRKPYPSGPDYRLRVLAIMNSLYYLVQLDEDGEYIFGDGFWSSLQYLTLDSSYIRDERINELLDENI